MAKVTLSDLANITGNENSAINTLNANWDLIEAAFDLCLFRDSSSPNQMNADLDMNSNNILNVGQITFSDGTDITESLLVTPDTTTDTALVRWDGIIGAALSNSGWLLSDSDVMTAGSHLDMSGSNVLDILSMTFTGGGSLDMNWATTKEHCEVHNSVSSSTNTIDLDLTTGNSFATTLTENISTTTFSNPPGSGKHTSFSWRIVQDAGASGYTVAFPASVVWAGGTAPTLTATANAVDIFVFSTTDGGTTWCGGIFGRDFS